MKKMSDFEQVKNWLEYLDFEYETGRDRSGRKSYILAKIPAKILKNFNDEDQIVDLMIQFDFLSRGDRDDQGGFEKDDVITRVAIIGLVDFICDSLLLSEDCISIRNEGESLHHVYIYDRA